MNRRHFGQNLMETAILIGVVAVAVILALTIFGGEVNSLLTGSHKKVEGYQPFGPGAGSTLSLRGGDLGGSPSSPASKCSGGNCSIDYGNFALNGISENFGELIETTGTSAGTKQLADIIQDIANQLSEKGEEEGSAQYSKLANLAHFMGDIQEANESAIRGCEGVSDVKTCAQTNLKTELNALELSESLKDTLTKYGGGTPLLFQNIIGNAKRIQNIAPSQFDSQKTQHPGHAIIEVYDDIMSNSSFPPELKDVTTKLYKNINDLAAFSSYSNIHINDFGFSRTGNYSKFDPITGNKVGTITINNKATTDLTNPQYFKGTDLNSALVCVSGSNHTDGSQCE